MAKNCSEQDAIRRHGILRGQYWLTRVVFLRCLGFVYAAAFLSALRDNGALLGEGGLLPATRLMSRVQQHMAHLPLWQKVLKVPTIFWFMPPTADNLWWAAAAGSAISCFVSARGAANVPAMAVLWALYHSLVNVGQTWYSFGWESQLLETGFLAMFLVPWFSLSRFPEGSPTSLPCVWGYRWLLFRIMLGAGLIKLRGDPCWRDLTCMDYHYQTQPNPNPLSLYLHHLPSADWHRLEVVVNHVVELVLPWCLLLSRRLRCFSGCVQILFQVALVISGNLSFLNWLTAVPAVFSFDDLHLACLFRPRVVGRLVRRQGATTSAAGAGESKVGAWGEGRGGGRGGSTKAAVPKDVAESGSGEEGAASDRKGQVSAAGDGQRHGDGVGTAVRNPLPDDDEAADDSGRAAAGGAAGGAGAAPALADGGASGTSKQSLVGAGSGVSHRFSRGLRWAADGLLVVLVVRGSIPVVKNMAGLGGGQRMNVSFGSLRIVNTYGNFGSVTKTRGEVVLKGTRHTDPSDPSAEWKEYDFRCKPGDVNQRPCVITPFHYRLDWQMWFAAFQSYGNNPWLVSLVWKLLSKEDESRALAGSLLRRDPFSGDERAGNAGGDAEVLGGPPRFIKADLYLYEFTAPSSWRGRTRTTTSSSPEGTSGGGADSSLGTCSEEATGSCVGVDGDGNGDGLERGAWWTRKFVREYLPPVSLENPSLRRFLASHGLE